MVGAVTTLIVIVAVFLAYNANNGLPFVPVYRASVEVPNGSRLVRNNEVRIGGHRVGVVESIEPIVADSDTTTAAAGDDAGSSAADAAGTDGASAILNLKLDQDASPLPQDSIFRVRYRSSFGLKYLEIVRGVGEPAPEGFVFDGLDDGGECQLPTDPESFAESAPETARNGCFQRQTEFDAINNTFDTETRTNSRINLVGFGDAFAARGASLNEAFASLRPLFGGLKPVAKTLADPDTGLGRLFEALGRSAEIVAPVAAEQAEFFADAGIAFEAISSDPDALRAAISEGPPTLETGIATLPGQQTFLADFAELSERLRPGIRQLRLALPDLNDAVLVGTPVLRRTPPMNRDLREVLLELGRIAEDPTTKITLQRLTETFDEARPLAEYVAPVQTVCNYWNYWFTYLTEHITEVDSVGFNQRIALVATPPGGVRGDFGGGPMTTVGEVQTPVAGYSGLQANGKAGAAPNPTDEGVFKPHELPILHGNPYGPLGQPGTEGGDDCQSGQNGYVLGDFPTAGQPIDNPGFVLSDIPGSRGITSLYWNQDSTRELRDTRIAAHQP